MTNKTSYDNIRAWLSEIREHANEDVVIMLLGESRLYLWFPYRSDSRSAHLGSSRSKPGTSISGKLNVRNKGRNNGLAEIRPRESYLDDPDLISTASVRLSQVDIHPVIESDLNQRLRTNNSASGEDQIQHAAFSLNAIYIALKSN